MSGKLNTKNIKAGGDAGTPKTLQPGNAHCKLNGVRLEDFKFKPDAYVVMLSLEGPDLGADFEGFWLDKTNESLGRHKGQVADVKVSEWAFADGETKTGILISRDAEMLKTLKSICIAFECTAWLENQDDKHDTIESLFKAFNDQKPFADKIIEFCIAGKEYLNKNGYVSHELFLPKYSKAGAPFGKTKVVTFNPEEHIRKKKVDVVSEFGTDEPTAGLSTAASSDFTL
jgi:hypothetical protein